MNSTMQGKVVLVTGATNGIGKVCALNLAKMGATVVIVGRSADKTQATAAEIKSQSGNDKVDTLLADLSLMADVRRLADEFKRKYDRLDVLVNNAGAYFASRQETSEGIEMTFALNHISYFLLTDLLLDVLKASAPARIVNVSSDAHQIGLDLNDLQSRDYQSSGFKAYGQSKMANILFTYELARRLEGTGVTANVLHPGFVATGFGRNNSGTRLGIILRLAQLFGTSPEKGAATMTYLSSSPEVEGITGKYWQKSKPATSAAQSYDVETARRLWEVSEQIVGSGQAAV